jgi:beta-CASP RNase J family ribonuclease
MEKVSQLAIELGYLHIPETYSIDIDNIHSYPNDKITVITTGSQGEPMSGLARMASSTHKYLKIEEKDMVIVSASPIPGNEKFVSRVINQMFKKGVEVIYDDIEDVHVSGHACQEEIKLIHSIVKPKFFVPVHGEYKHLRRHALLAEELGMDPKNITIMETGDVLELSMDEAKVTGKVTSGEVMVDGLGVGDVGQIVLRDRKHLAEDGMFTIVVTIEKESFSVIAGPDIITRGFVYARESEQLINEARELVRKELDKCMEDRITEWVVIKSAIKNSLGKFLYERTKRRPIILPIIMEI